MKGLEKKLQLQTLTNTEILTCCFTPTGQLVVDSTHHLNKQPTVREKAHLRAAFYWLKHYQPNSPSLLDKVKGYLEAAHHFRQLEVWDLVCQILFVSVNSDRIPLHEQLGIWGLYPEQIDLCEPLVGKVNHQLDCLCLNNLGFAYTHLCQYQTAISYYERLLDIAINTSNSKAQAKAFGGLGLCYGNWGQYQKAWDYCQQQLLVLDQIEKPSSQGQIENTKLLHCDRDFSSSSTLMERGQTLVTLGYLEIHLRRYRKAVNYCQQALATSCIIKDPQTQWYALGRLAVANAQLGKSLKALEALQQQYQQRHQNPNCRQVSSVLVNLGLVYCYGRNFDAAVTCGQELLEINQKSGNVTAQCYALLTLSFIHIWRNEVELAMEKTKQCLSLARQYSYQHHESQCLSQLSYLYSDLGEITLALDYGAQALEIAQTVNNPLFKGIALAVLGLAHLEEGKLTDSIRLIAASFVTLPPWRGGDSKLLLALIWKRSSNYLAKKTFRKSNSCGI